MKNGRRGSHRPSSKPAVRQRRTDPSGRSRLPSLSRRPRREASADTSSTPSAHRRARHVPLRAAEDPSERVVSGLDLIDDPDELQVPRAERHGPVRRPPARMTTAFDRCPGRTARAGGRRPGPGSPRQAGGRGRSPTSGCGDGELRGERARSYFHCQDSQKVASPQMMAQMTVSRSRGLLRRGPARQASASTEHVGEAASLPAVQVRTPAVATSR